MDGTKRPIVVPEAMDFSLEASVFRKALQERLHSLAIQNPQPVPLEDSELEFLSAAGDTSAQTGMNAFAPLKSLKKRVDE